jgi:hypothetical protein
MERTPISKWRKADYASTHRASLLVEAAMQAQAHPASDKVIRRQIIDALDGDPRVESAGIGVAMNYGVAVLTGQVPHVDQRALAEVIVTRVKGVTVIVDRIEVRPGGFAVGGSEDNTAAGKFWHLRQQVEGQR